MMKKLFLILILALATKMPALAEIVPLQIAPTEVISTEHDEIQVGDWVQFETTKDTYLDGKLYLKKGTPVVGVVDFYHPNGWCLDEAELRFKTFYFVNENNIKTEVNCTVNVNELSLIRNDVKEQTKHFFKTVIRGSEIYIEPDTKTFNIFITPL